MDFIRHYTGGLPMGCLAILTTVLCFRVVAVCGAENLAVDASFESPLPPWFAQREGTSYFAGKAEVAGAAGATFELALLDEKGMKLLASFGRLPLDGKGTWQTVSKLGVIVAPPVKTRLALVLTGLRSEAGDPRIAGPAHHSLGL